MFMILHMQRENSQSGEGPEMEILGLVVMDVKQDAENEAAQ